MESGYILIACGFVGLAIAYNLLGQRRSPAQRPQAPTGVRAWVTRELRRGDLRALSDAAVGRDYDITIDQIERLRDRGFVAKRLIGDGSRVTIKGWLALLLRATVARDHRAARLR